MFDGPVRGVCVAGPMPPAGPGAQRVPQGLALRGPAPQRPAALFAPGGVAFDPALYREPYGAPHGQVPYSPMRAGPNPRACESAAEGGLLSMLSSVGCAETAETDLSYVGSGRGEYITETRVRYVGAGAGNLSMVPRGTIYWGRVVLALVSLVLLLVLVYLLVPSPTTSTMMMQHMAAAAPPLPLPSTPSTITTTTTATTTSKTELIAGICTFWGDPHIKTFDGARPSFYGDGEFYIVRSDTVMIQGRYLGTKYTKGLAATSKVAIGGAFLQGHVITVGSMDSGPILVDGKPVLSSFPSSYVLGNLATINYNGEGKLVDDATDEWQPHIVHMQLPLNVRFTVLRWENYLDLRLVMPRQPHQDGSCGNFDGNPMDDTTVAIFSRIGARVPAGELLFQNRVDIQLTSVEEKLLHLCPKQQKEKAAAVCPRELLHVPEAETNRGVLMSCMLDICFGANEHTLRMATSLGL